jgi:manganese oxidase
LLIRGCFNLGAEMAMTSFRSAILVSAAMAWASVTSAQTEIPATLASNCVRLITAEIVALEQSIVLNRYGAFNPASMLYALMSDVVMVDDKGVESPLTKDNLSQAPGKVRLRSDKRPRPVVLRVNEADCLEVRLHNLLMPNALEERLKGPEQNENRGGLSASQRMLTVPKHMSDPEGVVYPGKKGKTGRELERYSASPSDWPRTRAVSFQVNGLEYVDTTRGCPESNAARQWVCGGQAGNVGMNLATINQKATVSERQQLKESGLLAVPEQGGLVYPGQSGLYRYRAFREGTYFAYSTGATVGGEGDGGQLGLGLFGAVNVQPKGSTWYRSQVSHAELRAVTVTKASKQGRHPYREIMFDKVGVGGRPILAMLDGNAADLSRQIMHTDLNAVVVLDSKSSGKSYREFTVIMHDEVKAVQAFAELEDESNPLHYVKDGMGINYGVGGMGAMLVAGQRKIASNVERKNSS